MATKMNSLKFLGIDGKGGLLKQWQEIAITEKKQVTKGLGAGLTVVVFKNSGKAYYYCRNPYTKIGSVNKVTLANAFKKVEQLKKRTQSGNNRTNDNSPLLSAFYKVWIEEKSALFKDSSTRICNFNSLYNKTIVPSGLSNLRLNEINPKTVYELLVDFVILLLKE